MKLGSRYVEGAPAVPFTLIRKADHGAGADGSPPEGGRLGYVRGTPEASPSMGLRLLL